MFFWGILLFKKGTSVIILPQENFISAGVTFTEKDNNFTNPYLQGEKSFVEDKDRDHSYLISLCLLNIILHLFVSQVP